MPRVHEKQIQKRKQEALDAAMRLLTDGGYANLNMDQLADEVGISKPTLYQYFNSKEELVAQALVHMFEKMEADLADDSGRSPLEQIERFLRTMLKSRYENRNVMSMADAEAIKAISQRHPFPQQHLVETRSRLAALVRKAQVQGEIDPAIPAWVIVRLMFSLQGVVGHRAMSEEIQRSDREMADAIDSAVGIFIRGIRAESQVTMAPHSK